MPRLSYTDLVDVYKASDDETNPWENEAAAYNVPIRIVQLDVFEQNALSSLRPDWTVTHKGFCDPHEDITAHWDRAMLKRSDGQQFLVLNTQEPDQRRGGKHRFVLLLQQFEGVEYA